jgi:hypothetical protein
MTPPPPLPKPQVVENKPVNTNAINVAQIPASFNIYTSFQEPSVRSNFIPNNPPVKSFNNNMNTNNRNNGGSNFAANEPATAPFTVNQKQNQNSNNNAGYNNNNNNNANAHAQQKHVLLPTPPPVAFNKPPPGYIPKTTGNFNNNNGNSKNANNLSIGAHGGNNSPRQPTSMTNFPFPVQKNQQPSLAIGNGNTPDRSFSPQHHFIKK